MFIKCLLLDKQLDVKSSTFYACIKVAAAKSILYVFNGRFFLIKLFNPAWQLYIFMNPSREVNKFFLSGNGDKSRSCHVIFLKALHYFANKSVASTSLNYFRIAINYISVPNIPQLWCIRHLTLVSATKF